MKILESITTGYKKIAAGIVIVSFLAIFYLAMILGSFHVSWRLPGCLT